MTRGRPPTGSKIGQGGIIQRMLKNIIFEKKTYIFSLNIFLSWKAKYRGQTDDAARISRHEDEVAVRWFLQKVSKKLSNPDLKNTWNKNFECIKYMFMIFDLNYRQ